MQIFSLYSFQPVPCFTGLLRVTTHRSILYRSAGISLLCIIRLHVSSFTYFVLHVSCIFANGRTNPKFIGAQREGGRLIEWLPVTRYLRYSRIVYGRILHDGRITR